MWETVLLNLYVSRTRLEREAAHYECNAVYANLKEELFSNEVNILPERKTLQVIYQTNGIQY